MGDVVRHCPYCGSKLVLVNVIQRFGERPKIHIFRCTGCKEQQFCTNGGADSRWADKGRQRAC
jgi:hypothetical protein